MRIVPCFCWIIMLAFTVLPPPAAAQECVQPAEHTAMTFLLIDGSDSAVLGENFETTLRTIPGMISPGERLLAALAVDKRANAHILIDIVKPAETLWESKLVIWKKQKVFNECVSKLKDMVLAQAGGGKKIANTALLETLLFTAEVFRGDASAKKRIIIYSDMIQNSDTLSFYKLSSKDTADKLLEKAAKEALVPQFPGVGVRVAGVGGAQSDKEARLAEQFWRLYFEKAGATLEFYGPFLVS